MSYEPNPSPLEPGQHRERILPCGNCTEFGFVGSVTKQLHWYGSCSCQPCPRCGKQISKPYILEVFPFGDEEFEIDCPECDHIISVRADYDIRVSFPENEREETCDN